MKFSAQKNYSFHFHYLHERDVKEEIPPKLGLLFLIEKDFFPFTYRSYVMIIILLRGIIKEIHQYYRHQRSHHEYSRSLFVLKMSENNKSTHISISKINNNNSTKK